MIVHHPTKIVKGIVDVPSSKSLSNRALVLQYIFGEENILIENLSNAADTILMQQCLQRINFYKKKIAQGDNSTFVIDAKNAGTTFRFLTALLANEPGNWLLTGDERMKQRPIKPLVDSLIQLGAEISYQNKNGFPPLLIKGKKLKGGNAFVETSISSQFASALLLIAPTFENGLELELSNNLVSESYIESTIGLLNEFGIKTKRNNNTIFVSPKKFLQIRYAIEADWSSIAFFVEIAAMADEAEIEIKNVSEKSLQGDFQILEFGKKIGVNFLFQNGNLLLKNMKNFDTQNHPQFDLQSTPDLTQPLTVACSALKLNASFNGIEHLSFKETDRLIALKNELRKINVDFEKQNDSFILNCKNEKITEPLIFRTYADHRMAMAFAPLCLKFGELEIENPNVVEKSFPNFWNELKKLGFVIN